MYPSLDLQILEQFLGLNPEQGLYLFTHKSTFLLPAEEALLLGLAW
jgi:hypothetical protein